MTEDELLGLIRNRVSPAANARVNDYRVLTETPTRERRGRRNRRLWEERARLCAELRDDGLTRKAIADLLDTRPSSVSKWSRWWREHGNAAVLAQQRADAEAEARAWAESQARVTRPPTGQAYVYVLTDTDGEPRYVGAATTAPSVRLRGHWNDRLENDRPISRWLRTLDEPPKMEIVQHVPKNRRGMAEWYWVSVLGSLPGANLLNISLKGAPPWLHAYAVPGKRQLAERTRPVVARELGIANNFGWLTTV